MSIIETKVIKKKSNFEESLSKLDLQSTLLLISVLAERALALQVTKKSPIKL